ncbi:MAG: ChbG/HpnK family deacetylase [Microgenomates group bacterium]
MKYTGGISIVIPIYNESTLLYPAITNLVHALKKKYLFEVILVENGSKDNTYALAKKLSQENKMIRVFHLNTPCYGAALKKGIMNARYPITIQFDLDLIDLIFLKNAVALLTVNDIVVGSKMLPGSKDNRAPFRYFASKLTNFFLQAIFHYGGTDTHGIKAYHSKKIALITKNLRPTHLFFDTEILLNAEAQGLRIVELPVSIHNLRPTRFNTKIILFQLIKEFASLVSKKKSFSQNKPFLPISADDFNLNPSVNKAILSLIRKGSIRTVSILPNTDLDKKALSIRKAVHLNLVEGRSVLAPQKIPSLVDKHGNFHPFPLLYLRLCLNLIRFDEIQNELDAQIRLVQKKYGRIEELNSHQHTHLLYPIDQIVAQLGQEHSIPDIRKYGEIIHFSFFGRCMHLFVSFLALCEHLLYGKILSQSPTLKKGALPISFMSWETKVHAGDEVELVAHPGTSYDRNSQFMKATD